MVLETIEQHLPHAFLRLLCLWILTTALVLAGRAVYNWTDGKVRDAAESLTDSANFDGRVEEIPRRTLERVAADTATPTALAGALASRLVARWGAATYEKRAGSTRAGARRWRRIIALHILFHADSPNILDLLEQALASSDREIVGAAVSLLGRIADLGAARLLIGALIEGRYPASRIATHLDRFPLRIADELQPLLREPAPALRFWGVTLLARYSNEREVGELASDPDERVRKAVAETLGSGMGKTEASSRLLAGLLKDESWIVRAHAARALGDLKRVEYAASIASLLADTQWWVRLAAKETLFALGESSVPVLLQQLAHHDRFARNGAAEVLQNLGWVDRVLEEAMAGRSEDSVKEHLRGALEAGGVGMVSSIVWRQGPSEAPKLEAFLGSLGLSPEEEA